MSQMSLQIEHYSAQLTPRIQKISVQLNMENYISEIARQQYYRATERYSCTKLMMTPNITTHQSYEWKISQQTIHFLIVTSGSCKLCRENTVSLPPFEHP